MIDDRDKTPPKAPPPPDDDDEARFDDESGAIDHPEPIETDDEP